LYDFPIYSLSNKLISI